MTSYDGIFIRDTLGDQGMIPSVTGAPTYSPDIICYQDKPLSPQDAKASYNRNICKKFLQDDLNNIYIRARNHSGTKTLSGKVKAFVAPINVLYTPRYWTPLTTIEGDVEVDLVDVDTLGKEISPNDIALVEKAFYLNGVKEPTKHHCMMGLVTNSDGTYIELPDSFNGDNELWDFLRNHPQIAYNNIMIVMPEKHTFETPVQYGNYDSASRKFIFSIEVQDGLDTLIGTDIRIQSTNVKNPISIKDVIVENKSIYSWEYTVPGTYFDYLNFVVRMPDYEKVKASLHVRNYAINQISDIMSPDVKLAYSNEVSTNTENGNTATQLGDFFLYLGENLDHIQPIVYSGRKTLSLPTLEVTKIN